MEDQVEEERVSMSVRCRPAKLQEKKEKAKKVHSLFRYRLSYLPLHRWTVCEHNLEAGDSNR